jgi:hypothetical protein
MERESLEFEIAFVGYIEAVVEPSAVVLFDLDGERRKPLAPNLRQ